jgi:hypothetical protein
MSNKKAVSDETFESAFEKTKDGQRRLVKVVVEDQTGRTLSGQALIEEDGVEKWEGFVASDHLDDGTIDLRGKPLQPEDIERVKKIVEEGEYQPLPEFRVLPPPNDDWPPVREEHGLPRLVVPPYRGRPEDQPRPDIERIALLEQRVEKLEKRERSHTIWLTIVWVISVTAYFLIRHCHG